MKLNQVEAAKLQEAWKAVYAAWNALEDLRPGGGFSFCVDDRVDDRCEASAISNASALQCHLPIGHDGAHSARYPAPEINKTAMHFLTWEA